MRHFIHHTYLLLYKRTHMLTQLFIIQKTEQNPTRLIVYSPAVLSVIRSKYIIKTVGAINIPFGNENFLRLQRTIYIKKNQS